MTNAVFEYDHILMRAEYRTADPHRHLAVHLTGVFRRNILRHCEALLRKSAQFALRANCATARTA